MKEKHANQFIAIIGLLSGLTLYSCSDYNQVVKSDDYNRKFELANELYDKGSAVKVKKNGKQLSNTNVMLRSLTLYEQVYQRSPKSGEGELSYFRIGKAYYLSGDYTTAGYYLGMFPQRFPFSQKAEEALFLSAMCGVNNSPHYTLDQTETEMAINTFQEFIDRYPNSSLVDSSNRVVDRLRFKLELKEFESVKLYAKTERYAAAVTTAITFLEDFPMSDYTEEVSYILVKNSYFLAKNSISSKKKERIDETNERYRTFVAAFPDSKYEKILTSYIKSLENERLSVNSFEN